jgi:hypothetical protein
MALFLFLGYWSKTTYDLKFEEAAALLLLKHSQFVYNKHTNTWTELNEKITCECRLLLLFLAHWRIKTYLKKVKLLHETFKNLTRQVHREV